MRNRRRPRISPKRAASPSPAAGLLRAVFATVKCPELVLELAARRQDGRAGSLGSPDFAVFFGLQRDSLLDLAREHDLRALSGRRHHAGLLQRLQIHHVALDLRQFAQANLGAGHSQLRAEADLRHPALDGHLAAFEADLVVATLAGALTLDAPAAGLALAGGRAAAHAQARTLGARTRLNCVQSHTLNPC